MGNGAAAMGDSRIRPGVSIGPRSEEITDVVQSPHPEHMTQPQAKKRLSSIRRELINQNDYSGGVLQIRGNTLYVVNMAFSGGGEPLLDVIRRKDGRYYVGYCADSQEYNPLAA